MIWKIGRWKHHLWFNHAWFPHHDEFDTSQQQSSQQFHVTENTALWPSWLVASQHQRSVKELREVLSVYGRDRLTHHLLRGVELRGHSESWHIQGLGLIAQRLSDGLQLPFSLPCSTAASTQPEALLLLALDLLIIFRQDRLWLELKRWWK